GTVALIKACIQDNRDEKGTRGDSNLAQQLAVLCGREIPGPIRSTGEYMFIRFTSDSSVTRAGFNASFHK
ncbi:hypothetical protein P7K49_014803, partial [Saguinus oedipus]